MFHINEVRAWKKNADWPRDEQVEQDLIISITLVKIFNHPFLKDKLVFRGGTALNKLIFPKALRYSEDIDMNRLENTPAGPILDSIKDALKDLFPSIRPKIKRTKQSVKITYPYPSIAGGEMKLKIEINVRETLPQRELQICPYEVNSGAFTGKANVLMFNREKMIGTKVRALYQRKKGRDLFDLFELDKIGVDWDLVVESFKKLDISASREDFEKNIKEKMSSKLFLNDIVPLLPNDASYNVMDAYEWFLKEIIPRM